MTVLFALRGEDAKALTRPLLERAVKLAWGWDRLPPLERSARGKPRFKDREGFYFSLSHSGEYALCALSDEGEVGADIEAVRPHRPGLPQYALSEAELAQFDGSWEDFARIWTLKESWCKMEDSPLFPPRRVVTPPPCPHAGFGGEGWRAAVCCRGAVPEEVLWLEPPAQQR